MSRRHPVARLLLVAAVVCGALAVPFDRGGVQGSGGAFAVDSAVVVHTDYDARVITVTVAMAFYSRSCSAGTSCAVSAADIARITAAIELYWKGFNYKCFKVVVKIVPRAVASQAEAGPAEVDVGLDYTPMSGVRSFVRAVGEPDQYLSDDPAARVRPQHDPSEPTTWAAQTDFPTIWAHEFGHILGLQDNYASNDNTKLLPGAAEDLMYASRRAYVSQEMIDRVVRRSGKVDEKKMKCGYQFEFSGSGPTQYGDPPANDVTVSYHYWGLLCPGSREWQIWEHVESEGPGGGPSSETGRPGPGSFPVIATFDDNGMMIASSWNGHQIYAETLTGSQFTLSPPQHPTTLTARISAGDSRYHLPPVSVPVKPMDGSFGPCKDGS
jgi:hypothetical protein